MFRQFRHPSSCPARMRFFFVFTFIRTNLMAFIWSLTRIGELCSLIYFTYQVIHCVDWISPMIYFAAYLSSNAASNMFSITDPSSRVCCNFFSLSLCDCAACPSRWCEEWRGMIVGEAKIAANFACRISRNARLEDDAPAKKAAVGWLYTHTRRCLVCRNLSTAWIDPQVYR